MHKTNILLGAFVALGLIGAAHADTLAGSYKLAVGTATTCAITLADDGTASYTGDCSAGAGVARWQAKYNGVELQTASGETVGILKAKGDAYAGTRFSDGRPLTLSH
jgi:hypothetical protein